MVNRSEKTYNSVMVVQRSDYKWGVTDLEGNIIVPFGKYDWIDGFDQGLARVKIGRVSSNQVNNSNKWGIINEEGEEVLPVEYDEIWKFIGKNRYSTKVVKDGVKKEKIKCFSIDFGWLLFCHVYRSNIVDASFFFGNGGNYTISECVIYICFGYLCDGTCRV